MPEKAKLHRDVPCPFCSLLCDDLVIQNVSDSLVVKSKGCDRAIKFFQRKEPHTAPLVNGNEVSISDAITHAAMLLRESEAPLFTGSATDIAGCQELLALAEKTSATIDHAHGDAMANSIQVTQNSGMIMTTLAELKNRADMIVFIGTDTVEKYPRFFERLVWNQASLAGLKRNQRNIAFLGERLDARVGKNPDGTAALNINCSKRTINEYLSVARALINGGSIEPNSIPASDLGKLKKLVNNIHSAKYGVIVWDSSELLNEHGDMTAHLISAITRDLNVKQRFASLSLGGNNGANALSSVCTWQSGFPLRVRFKNGSPSHDLYAYSTSKIINDDSNDALLWISSFDSTLAMPNTSAPTIVLSRPSRRAAQGADVYIPLATPGLDHAGNLTRTDSVVSLRLKKLRELNLPECSSVLESIRERI